MELTFEKQARQGDVWLERVEKLPKDATQIPNSDRGCVLAVGLATGHAHVLMGPTAKLYQKNGDRYLVVEAPTALEHDEHAPILVPSGVFWIGMAREYVPGGSRNVED